MLCLCIHCNFATPPGSRWHHHRCHPPPSADPESFHFLRCLPPGTAGNPKRCVCLASSPQQCINQRASRLHILSNWLPFIGGPNFTSSNKNRWEKMVFTTHNHQIWDIPCYPPVFDKTNYCASELWSTIFNSSWEILPSPFLGNGFFSEWIRGGTSQIQPMKCVIHDPSFHQCKSMFIWLVYSIHIQ